MDWKKRFKYAACERTFFFWNMEIISPFSKIFGYIWTGPKTSVFVGLYYFEFFMPRLFYLSLKNILISAVYVWTEGRYGEKITSHRHRRHKEMAVKKTTTTTTKPHGLYYFEFFVPRLFYSSLKNILINGLKCVHTKQLIKSVMLL